MLLTPSQHRKAAKDCLAAAQHPGRVILLHTGVVVLLSLLLTLADHLLDLQIATTGGLSGLADRAIFSTIQYLLRLLPLVLLPFWQIGYTYYTLRVARSMDAGTTHLLEGFHRFFPVLRLKLLTTMLFVGLAFACSYVSSFIFMATPWAVPVMAQMEQLMSQELSDAALMEAIMEMAQDVAVPILVIFSICFLIGSFFLFYRIRLAEFWLMDHPGKGALAALMSSRQLMHGAWKEMFKIDLGFWWFFLLELLVSALGMGDMILNYFGISMSTDAFVTYLIFFSLYLWAQLMLYWWKKNHISVTYAHAYLTLCPDEVPEEPAKM